MTSFGSARFRKGKRFAGTVSANGGVASVSILVGFVDHDPCR